MLSESAITAADITRALHALGVRVTDAMLVHSGLQGSGRVDGARSRDKLATITAGLRGAVAQGTLIVPTFTYSFCKGEAYDVAASPSTVGLLGEHVRRLPEARRTADPIFSAAVVGPVDTAFEAPLFAPGGKACFGAGSVFAQLLARDGLVVFYDVGFGFCTFVHHVEWLLQVQYRFLKRFTGTVRDAAGQEHHGVRADFLVRPLDGTVETFFDPLLEALLATGAARRGAIPGGPALLVAESRAILEEARRGVAANPDFLLARGHAVAAA